ncbi:MAG: integrin alpha [Planctomycetes bacterium]|nr:integrin alpha [Planctomycetota bacterium]
MKAMHWLVAIGALGASGTGLFAQDYKFDAPRKVMGGDKAIEVESPGYAAPSLADLNGDGVPDLLVGQFRDGKITVFKGSRSEDGTLSFGEGEFLKAGGEVAIVPGVW